MSTFAMAPRVPVPAPAAAFPTGIQFQDNGVDVGPPNPANVSIDGVNSALTYDSATDTVHVAISNAQSGVTPAVVQPNFSATMQGDQTSGTVVIFDNVTTRGGRDVAGYDQTTGLFTVPAGQGGMWQFGASVVLSPGGEVLNAARHFDIDVNGVPWATTDERLVQAAQVPVLNVVSQFVLADGDVVRVHMSDAFTTGINGISASGGPNTRFWGQRLSD